MKFTKKYLFITIILLFTVLFTTATTVKGVPQDTVRVWVSYQSGRKAEAFQALNKVNASLHYDFPELEAYVVTLPAAALNGILHNPFVVSVEGVIRSAPQLNPYRST